MENDPLMFIQTVNNLNNSVNNQVVFDSKKVKNSTNFIVKETNEINNELKEKLEKLVKCYNSNINVGVKVILKDGKFYEGTVKNFSKNLLFLDDEKINVSEISEIEMIKINF